MKPNGWGPRKILLTAAAGVLFIVVISLLSWCWADRPASEFPAWLEAFATVFGVGAAIVAGFYAARAFGLEFQREQRWEHTQRSAQASLIAAWYGTRTTKPFASSPNPGFERLTITNHGVYLRNASDLPVTGVAVALRNLDGEVLAEANLGVLPPSSEPVHYTMDSLTPSDDDPDPLVSVTFVDGAGIGWARGSDGRLAEFQC